MIAAAYAYAVTATALTIWIWLVVGWLLALPIPGLLTAAHATRLIVPFLVAGNVGALAVADQLDPTAAILVAAVAGAWWAISRYGGQHQATR